MASPFSGKAGRNAAIWGATNAQDYGGKARSELDKGYEEGKGYLQTAADGWTPLVNLYGKGANLYADSLGLNGGDGSTRARSAFEGYNPGYAFERDEAQRAGERAAAAGGRLASGGALIELADRGQNLARTNYNNWQQQLAGYNPLYTQATQGQGGAYGALSDLATNYRTNRAASLQNEGDAVTGIGMSGMMAGQQAANNRLQFGMSLGNTLASLAGSAMGGGGGMFGKIGLGAK